MEVGQLIHNNPVGAPVPYYVGALIDRIRADLARAFWNTQQKQWEGSRDFDPWIDRERPHGLTPLPPGIEWRHYYNWGGSPEDNDWDQTQADEPNLSFEGVEIRWYKHFGRSMNANVVWEAVKWVRWFERCIQTISAWESSNCCAFTHAVPFPDQNGKVPLEASTAMAGMQNWRTDFENVPDDRTICFFWQDGGHDGFGGSVCAMNFGVKETQWLSPPSHWTIIDPPMSE